MGQREELGCRDVIFGVFLVACGFGLVVSIVNIGVEMALMATSRGPEYTVAVTGVAGLDHLAAGGTPTTLSPVFNLTVRIDNAGHKVLSACVRGRPTVVVSYGDAFLGRGSVPAFCAGVRQVEERAATAWGQDVAVPRFLRERLAGELERGEAEVDVQVTISPAGCPRCGDTVLVCKAKIGGGPSSPCGLDYVYPRPDPAVLSRRTLYT
ncbi:hypothetical protein ACP70R_009941 [Stipagrostis hirtigluma subsp. patula]